MQISSRFTAALHIFACVDTFKDDHKVTSDFLASSINTNPVIIRKILTQLKSAGLINVARGTGGIELTRDLSEITFFDVYEAIEPVEDGDLFRFHEAPNPECPVGRNIHALLDDKLKAIQNAMEAEMKKYTLLDLRTGMKELLAKEAQGFVKDSEGIFQVPESGRLSMSIPAEFIPKCPDDGSDVTMNLRADDTFVEDEGWYMASAAYSNYLRDHEGKRVLYLELGVGANTPVFTSATTGNFSVWCRATGNRR